MIIYFFLLGLQTSRRRLIAEVSELHSHDVELCVFMPRRSQILKGLLCKQRVEGNVSRRRETVTHHLLDGAQIDIPEKPTNPAGTRWIWQRLTVTLSIRGSIMPQHNITACNPAKIYCTM